MSGSAGLRYFAQRAQYQAKAQIRQTIQRRAQSTIPPNVAPQPELQQSLFQRLWTSEVGIKTVHFWYVQAKKMVPEDESERSWREARDHCTGNTINSSRNQIHSSRSTSWTNVCLRQQSYGSSLHQIYCNLLTPDLNRV